MTASDLLANIHEHYDDLLSFTIHQTLYRLSEAELKLFHEPMSLSNKQAKQQLELKLSRWQSIAFAEYLIQNSDSPSADYTNASDRDYDSSVDSKLTDP